MRDQDEFEDDLGSIERDRGGPGGGAVDDGGLPPPPRQLASEKDVNQWAMWIHLSNLLAYVLWPISIAAPIILWQVKRDEMPGLDVHGKNAVNWAISFSIYAVASVLLMAIFIGFLTGLALAVVGIVFPIMAGVKANEGIVWPYPLSIRFLK
jgi:uncharacterized Tic20 family protein